MHDYVIVGAGSAGCVLARRLSDDPAVRVCLLEAGDRDDSVLVQCPAGIAAILPTRFRNWAYQTVPQRGLNGRRGYQPRGRVLGGSSSVNAMIYTRGQPADYDAWAKAGCAGWAWNDVLPYFLRAENREAGASALHATGGPLNVARLRSPNAVGRAFLAAAAEAGLPVNDDFNGPVQEGVGEYEVTQVNGERCSAARAYLASVLGRPNLGLLTGAHATRVLFQGKRAVGVAYRHGGENREVRAAREVLLAGGAFASPQLLLLSGVGPAAELRELGIDVVHDLPGVGRNLHDHVDFVFVTKSPSTVPLGLSLTGGAQLLRAIGEWRRRRTGMLTTNYAEAGAFLRSDPTAERPDIQLHFVIGIVDDHNRRLHPGHGYSCHVCVLRPKSRGTVRLARADAFAAPLIDPNFLAEGEDLETLLRGYKITKRILGAPALAPYRGRELYTAQASTDDEIRAVIRARADTVYHPVGSCRMGVDEGAVVDPMLRVRGLEGLRVADASIMPSVVSGNTNAPAIMIGEKAADLIRAARGA
jgi:choline dehydrogenase-like flavoprotein